MLLAIDIGNSNIVFGVNNNNSWKKVWRIQSDPLKTADEYEVIFRSLLLGKEIRVDSFRQIIISSVVPSLLNDFIKMTSHLTGIKPLILGPELYPKLPLNILNPYEIGTDLVANAIAALSKYKQDVMIIDFGTALTFTSIAKEGGILGVAIAPGLRTAIKSLAGNTAQLPHVQLNIPPSALGKNTVHAIQSGILIGYTGLIEHMIKESEKAANRKLLVIATGGLSSVLGTQTTKISHIEENLTLDGLKTICKIIQA